MYFGFSVSDCFDLRYQPASNARRDLPYALERIISQLLARNPSSRPTAGEVINLIDAIELGTSPIDGALVRRRSSFSDVSHLHFRLIIVKLTDLQLVELDEPSTSQTLALPAPQPVARTSSRLRRSVFTVSALVKV